ncbi:MAG: hypothetical protein KGJ62_08045 [Armatimonadetes bacterium]|nr:hypothetical protein [Armatimonadota bacterium]MDE2205227.1 hypothetical protein [Armatimonadota bacterium]
MNSLLTAVYDSGMDERVIETLEEMGISGWTRLFGAHGLGGAGRRQNTPIWPGTVNVLYVAGEHEPLELLAGALRALPASYTLNPGLTMWLAPVEMR